MNDSPFGHAHQHGDCYATWYAKKKAAELIGHFKFNESDREDIEQTLLLKLIERWSRFDPERATPLRFITWAIQKGVADVVRDRRQQMKFEPTAPVRVEELLADETLAEPQCQIDDHTSQLNLQMDVEAVLRKLPPELREIAEQLQERSVAEIARSTGKSRQAIRYALRQIREAFTEAGFEHAGRY